MIGRPLAGMVSLVARRGALTATRQGGGVGAVHGVRFAVAVLKTSAKYLKPRINLVAKTTTVPLPGTTSYEIYETRKSLPSGGGRVNLYFLVRAARFASSGTNVTHI